MPCERCRRFACPTMMVTAAWAFRSCATSCAKQRDKANQEWLVEKRASHTAQEALAEFVKRIEQDEKGGRP